LHREKSSAVSCGQAIYRTVLAGNKVEVGGKKVDGAVSRDGYQGAVPLPKQDLFHAGPHVTPARVLGGGMECLGERTC